MNCTVRIDLAYDGGGFHGWQFQPGLRTVQGVLEAEVTQLVGRKIVLFGAGRTDAGVHALGQVAHVGGLNSIEALRLERILPGRGPDDLRITSVREVSPEFHARFSACWRRYEYRISFIDDLFLRGTRWRLVEQPDRTAIDAACVHLIGRHDYRSFCKTSSCKADNHCHVTEAGFVWHEDGAVFHVQADRFLHHMVRIMVGTLLEVGRGHRVPDDIPAIIAACERSAAGTMAPPQGLYLAEVGYPDELMDPGRRPDTNDHDDDAGHAGAQPEENP